MFLEKEPTYFFCFNLKSENNNGKESNRNNIFWHMVLLQNTFYRIFRNVLLFVASEIEIKQGEKLLNFVALYICTTPCFSSHQVAYCFRMFCNGLLYNFVRNIGTSFSRLLIRLASMNYQQSFV